MEIVQNTLFVLTQGAYLSKDHETLRVEVERECRLAVPLHHLESVVVFGNVMVSPFLMNVCAERGIALTFSSESGRLLARVDAPGSGNVLLRREQFRQADCDERSTEIARRIVAGKIHNSRILVQRSARESDESVGVQLTRTADELGAVLPLLESAESVDVLRGFEGRAADLYFKAFPLMTKQQTESFSFSGRTRRPPLDRINALLSFLYAILLHDCVAALSSTGLDPSVGFLHEDRSGRPSLALDLMEEFRPLIADRLVFKLINKRLVSADGFRIREGGAVEMDDSTRKTVLTEYQQRKKETVEHPLLKQRTRIGLLPYLQARLLARHIRGELDSYPPCILR